jgi:hypothetical protein
VLHLPLVVLLLGVPPLLGLPPLLLLQLLLSLALVLLLGLQPPSLLLLPQCRQPSVQRNLPGLLLPLLMQPPPPLLHCHPDHQQQSLAALECVVWQAVRLCGSRCSGTNSGPQQSRAQPTPTATQ